MAAVEGWTIGSAFGGPVGGAVGLALGGIYDIWSAITAYQNQQESTAISDQNTYLSRLLSQLNIEGELGNIDIGLQEAKATKSAYEAFLQQFPASADLQLQEAQTKGEADFRKLMGNFGTINAIAGATGNVGPASSYQAFGEQARKDVANYAGEDLALGGEGANAGLFEKGMGELKWTLDQQKATAEAQIGIYNTSIETLTKARGNYQSALDYLKGLLATPQTPVTPETPVTSEPPVAPEQPVKPELPATVTTTTETTTTQVTDGSNQGSTTLDPADYDTLAAFEAAGGQATDWYAVHGYTQDPGSTGNTNSLATSTQVTDGTGQGSTTLDPSAYDTLAAFEAAGGQATDWYAVHGTTTENKPLSGVITNINATGTTAGTTQSAPTPPDPKNYVGDLAGFVAAGGDTANWYAYWNSTDSTDAPPPSTEAGTDGYSSYDYSDLLAALGLTG